MNSLPTATHVVASPTPSVRLRTGLVFFGTSVVTVALVGWGVARAMTQISGLEAEHSRFNSRLIRVEKIIGESPATVVETTPVARHHLVAEGE